MAVVNFPELHQHAAEHGYGLAVTGAHALPVATGILDCAMKLDAPLVLAVDGGDLDEGLLPSLEALARQAGIPVALAAVSVTNTDQAVRAIRFGCNGIVLADDIESGVAGEIRNLVATCGVPVMTRQELPAARFEIDEAVKQATLQAFDGVPASWKQFNERIARAASSCMQDCLTKAGAAGQGQAALKHCRPWRPVEHLIIYNTITDDRTSAEIAAEGRRVLDRIPGVRATWSGRAVKEDAGYRWCWLIRFAHVEVIDSYREHPDHKQYADSSFRPVAGDRISIDFELTGADER